MRSRFTATASLVRRFVTSRAGEYTVAALIAGVFLFNVAGFYADVGPAVVDDAFIFFRYASHLAQGSGLVYNPGEYVEGYTSLLWTLVLAGVISAGLDPLPSGQILCVLFGLVQLLASWRIAKLFFDEHPFLCLLPPLLLATNRSYCAWAIEPMDAKLFGALFALALWTWLRLDADRKLRGSPLGVLLGMLVLCRPEGYLFALCIGVAMLHASLAQKRLAWFARQALVFAAIAAGHLAFRVGYYGDWLPNTYYAKVGGAGFAAGSRYLAAAIDANHVWISLPLAAIGFGVFPFFKRTAGVLCSTVFALYLGAVLYLGGDYFEFRFLDVVLPLWALFVTWGVWALGKAIPGAAALPRRTIVLAVAIAALVTNGWSITRPFEGRPGITTIERERDFVLHFARVGRWLGKNLADGESIAIRPAGVIAYLCGARSLDLLGLTNAEIARDPRFYTGGVSGHQRRVPVSYARQLGITYWIGQPLILRQASRSDRMTSVEVSPRQFLIFRTLDPNAKYPPGIYRLNDHAGSLRGWAPADRR